MSAVLEISGLVHAGCTGGSMLGSHLLTNIIYSDPPAALAAICEVVDGVAEDDGAVIPDGLREHFIVLGVEVARRENGLARARFLEGGEVHLASYRPDKVLRFGCGADLLAERQGFGVYDFEALLLQKGLYLGLVGERALRDKASGQVDLAARFGCRDGV